MKFCIIIYVNIVITTGMHNSLFDGRGFAEHKIEKSKICSQLVNILINLKPLGLFGSIFVYFCILTLSSEWYSKR